MDKLKIACVKSSVYQDLWVSDITCDYTKIFKTTLMRCPAIGLSEKYSADFIIVKDTNEFPCNINKNVLPQDCFHSLQYSRTLKNPSMPFLDETYHNNVSIDSLSHNVDDIDWNTYNIVICINTCIPERILSTFKKTLWCYYVGENEDRYVNNLISKYDVILNQDVFKQNIPPFSIGFPYSFLDPYTIENMMNKMGVFNDNKHGVFQEINNTQDRPVSQPHPAFLEITRQLNIPILLHSQNIVENIKCIFNSKYFVKIYGRVIRGNGVLEVISAGTLILLNKNLIMFHDLIPNECHVETIDDVIQKIKYFENNETEYQRVVQLQRLNLYTNYFMKPMNNLYAKYCQKFGL
jgi:hypothetical protein